MADDKEGGVGYTHMYDGVEEEAARASKRPRQQSSSSSSGGQQQQQQQQGAVVVVIDDDPSFSSSEGGEEREEAKEGGAMTVAAAAPLSPPSLLLHPRLAALLASVLGPDTASHSQRLPRLFVLDLDFTLWCGNVSDHCPPFEPTGHPDRLLCFRRRSSSSTFMRRSFSDDSRGGQQTHFGLFPEARVVLEALRNLGAPVAIASRAPDRQAAEAVLSLLGIKALFFQPFQIFPESSKTTHLRAILKATGIPPHQTLMFDDEPRNVKDVRALGCSACLVQRHEGLSWRALEEGLRGFKQAGASRGLMASYFSKSGGGKDNGGKKPGS